MDTPNRKSLAGTLLLTLACALLAFMFETVPFFNSNADKAYLSVVDYTNKYARELRTDVESALQTFAIQGQNCIETHSPDKVYNWYEDAQKALFFFSEGRLTWWTDQRIPFDEPVLKQVTGYKMITLSSGKYLAYGRLIDKKQVIGLKLIEQKFSYQNDFLVNGFNFPFYLPENTKLSLKPEPSSKAITLFEQNIAWISIPDFVYKPEWSSATSILFWGLTFLFFLVTIVKFINRSGSKKSALFIGFFLMLVLRTLLFYFRKPDILFQNRLFSPDDYASSWLLPSLGDLLLNVLMGVVLMAQINKHIVNHKFTLPKWSKMPIIFVLPAFFFVVVFSLFNILRGLIFHSNIALDISDFLSIDIAGYTSFLIFSLVCYIIFLICDSLIRVLIQSEVSNFVVILQAALGAAFVLIVFKPDGPLDITLALCIALLYLIIHKYVAGSGVYGFNRLVVLISLFSFSSTLILHFGLNEREEKKRENLAMKISEERDPIAESIFVEVERDILKDTLLKKYLTPGFSSKQVIDLGQRFFSGYWEKYSINFHVFGNDDCALSMAYTGSDITPLRLDKQIDSIGMPTADDNLFYINNGSGRINYVARLDVTDQKDNSHVLGQLYIEFSSRFTPEELGYPELLLDKFSLKNTDISQYKVARYKFGQLVSKYGDYQFEITDANYSTPESGNFKWHHRNGYKHLIYSADNTLKVVISTRVPTLLSFITPFSYLALIMGLLAALIYRKQIVMILQSGFTLKRRVQLGFITVLVIAVVLIGSGSLYFIVEQNQTKNYKGIAEKAASISTSLSQFKLIEQINPLYASEQFDITLKQLAEIFYTDINVYDARGYLYMSSQPKIFEEGLLSKYIHPAALLNLQIYPNAEFINEEKIGKLNFTSAYVPLTLNNGVVNGYLNLPFFARQSEFRKEITRFVTAIINTNIFLVVLVVFASILLANTVTGPLQLIREKLSTIRLGKKNEIIEWNGKDEIADLINEYNRLIGELSVSADKLAKSERESAWREMAKQVAHEIKNPLTPMKLSVQLLQKAWLDKSPDFQLRLERFTQTLTEQIDTLSHIATEFSNFAKMPTMVKENVNIVELLENAIDFYQNPEGPEVSFINHLTTQSAIVETDKEQMIRVLNNLIKNAIQAIEIQETGKIKIELSEHGNSYLLSFQDNGSGISYDLKDKIFEPNFTTKKSGMGLGLALVKNIVEGSGGNITFESSLATGTTFYIELPKVTT